MVDDWKTTVDALASIGPALSYVGFSMGAIFGAATVAAIPSIQAAVFVVGGIPAGGGIDDPPLRDLLLAKASELADRQVLMLNMTNDNIFPVTQAHTFFDAIPGTTKRLMFWSAAHDDWPDEAIEYSSDFINRHVNL